MCTMVATPNERKPVNYRLKNFLLSFLAGMLIGLVCHLVGVDRQWSLTLAFVAGVLISVGADVARILTRK